MVRFFCIALCCLLWGSPGNALAVQIARPTPEVGSLTIINATSEDVMSISFRTKHGLTFTHYDMAPDGRNEMENPGEAVDIQVDVGLSLWTFKDVPVGQSVGLTLRHSAAPEIELHMPSGGARSITGEVQELLPVSDMQPVCALQRFRPGMTMKDVCTLLDAKTPHDANGALLTSLGFAGLTWAARLEPRQAEQGQNSTAGDAVLDRLELRRKLDTATLDTLLGALHTQNYMPWQVELPGVDINFAQMFAMDAAKRNVMLQKLLEYFLLSGKGEASIMLVPAEVLPHLSDADMPGVDVQLFTITLRPASHSLVVEVVSYDDGRGSDPTLAE